jgi:predicted RNA-binding protein YlxR (DUF448 family)
LGCGARDDQKKLIRLIATDQAGLQVEKQGRRRGGYLHHDQECWQAFLRRKSLHRAFHMAIDKDAKERLIKDLKERHWE